MPPLPPPLPWSGVCLGGAGKHEGCEQAPALALARAGQGCCQAARRGAGGTQPRVDQGPAICCVPQAGGSRALRELRSLVPGAVASLAERMVPGKGFADRALVTVDFGADQDLSHSRPEIRGCTSSFSPPRRCQSTLHRRAPAPASVLLGQGWLQWLSPCGSVGFNPLSAGLKT